MTDQANQEIFKGISTVWATCTEKQEDGKIFQHIYSII